MTRRTFLPLPWLACTPLAFAEWNQWRGPERDGKSPATGLLERWPEGGPPLAWEAEGLGEGYASFSFVNGRLYTQGQRGGRQFLIALDAGTGRKLWETPNGDSYDDRRGSGPRGAPTIDGETVYALAANGSLLAAEAASGREIWRVPLLQRFGGSNIRWGISESPLIDGDKIIVSPGGRGAGVVALDKSDGGLIWKSQSDEPGYSSPVVAEIGGLRTYVLLTGEAAIGLRADNGELLWRYPQVANSTANIATPIVREPHVFVSSDYGVGCALLRLERSGGDVSADEVYFHRDMRNHYSSSVLLDDHLYGFSSSILTCMRFETGEVAWRDRSVGKGQIIYADGRLYLLSEDGVVGLVEPSPAAYREVSRFELKQRSNYPSWTLPVIADGKLVLRDQERVWAYNVKAG